VSDEIEELGDETKETLAEGRETLPEPARVHIRAVPSDALARWLGITVGADLT
jgi:hypothetical protein